MTTTESTALAVRDSSSLGLRFAIPLDELRHQIAQLDEFKRDIMVEGVDYGVIPGTPKPTLYKPGAEKLTLVFGLAPTFEVTNRIEDWERGFFHYETRCDITNRRTGEVIASAHGSCNSWEPRYHWRKAERLCPNCAKPAIIKGKAEFGGGWLCWARKGGCGAKFETGDPEIEGQEVGNVANPEPYELVNTLIKMSEKRSLVAATLIATGGSAYFTQDVEDMPSVAGDGPVIDVAPSQQQAAPGGDVIRSADDRVWKRWLDIASEAMGLGLHVTDVTLPIARSALISKGTMLTATIDQRKRQLAEEDAARAEGKREHDAEAAPVDAEPEDADLVQVARERNESACKEAEEIGVKGVKQLRWAKTDTIEDIERKTFEAEERTRSRNNELDMAAAQGSGQAAFS